MRWCWHWSPTSTTCRSPGSWTIRAGPSASSALDIYDDALHLASALWALAAALISVRASRMFLILFGALYFLDGLLGCFAGSGFWIWGIFTWGWLEIPVKLKDPVLGPASGAWGLRPLCRAAAVRAVFRWLKRLVLLVVVLALGLLSPIAWVETMCRPSGDMVAHKPLVGADWQRPEGRTLLTYRNGTSCMPMPTMPR